MQTLSGYYILTSLTFILILVLIFYIFFIIKKFDKFFIPFMFFSFLLLCLAGFAFLALGYITSKTPNEIISNAGAIGDFIGGFFNPIFGLLGLGAIILTLHVTNKGILEQSQLNKDIILNEFINTQSSRLREHQDFISISVSISPINTLDIENYKKNLKVLKGWKEVFSYSNSRLFFALNRIRFLNNEDQKILTKEFFDSIFNNKELKNFFLNLNDILTFLIKDIEKRNESGMKDSFLTLIMISFDLRTVGLGIDHMLTANNLPELKNYNLDPEYRRLLESLSEKIDKLLR